MKRRTFLMTGFGVSAAAIFPSLQSSAQDAPPPAYILGATAITKVFGGGQRLVGIAIEQDRSVTAEALDPTLYSVTDRTITRVYPSASPKPDQEDATGSWIILDLSHEDAAAALIITDGRTVRRLPAAATVTITPKSSTPAEDAQQGPPDFNSIPRSLPTETSLNLVVDAFDQDEFIDAETGDTLAYNLYEPLDRDPSKPLPLVLFMHDAGNTSPLVDTTLVQGLGAVCWASPEDQAAFPALVLAPQYSSQTVDDSSQATSLLDTTLHLLDHISKTRNIDPNRIYVTGQSGGGMMSIAMMVKEPELFAAAFLVACQWDPAVVQPLAKQKLWVVVAEGDEKAFPGQTAIMQVIEAEGTAHSEAVWDGTADAATLAKAVEDQANKGTSVNFSVLKKGSVVPVGQDDNPGSNHVNTWRIAYDIPSIRTWIMAQAKVS